MRIRQRNQAATLGDQLAALLSAMREARRFEPGSYIDDTAALLNTYLERHQLGAAVVAISGGVDSGLVAALVAHASARPDSPLRRIVYVTAPVHSTGVVTGQNTAAALAAKSMAAAAAQAGDNVDVTQCTLDLSDSYDHLEAATRAALGEEPDRWARGQLAATIRTPAVYYMASMLTAAGTPAVVVGTTNRDEGAWLGYVGKTSDGAVDIQPISDIHKSEVYACAEHLGVPVEVRDATPTGDMYDNTIDTDVFGAPYDFVELYLGLLCDPELHAHAARRWNPDTADEYNTLAAALEALHAANAHKYLVGDPAVHLDLYPRTVPGGQQNPGWVP